MKTILKYSLFIVIGILLIYCNPNPTVEPDNIFSSFEPDTNFLNALIDRGVDLNGDGIISANEAEAVTVLDVSDCGITDMTGIHLFYNLDTLICEGNSLTTLDVSKNTFLKYLDCSGCGLTTLDVSKNTLLTHMDVGSVSMHLWLFTNSLTTLDVSNNTALENLKCDRNQLTSLNLSNNTALKYLDCSGCGLTTLNVSKNTLLTYMNIGAAWSHVWYSKIFLYNYLPTLDVSKNTTIEWLGLSNMPSLYKVCVWQLPFPPIGVEVDTYESPNVYFTTDCD